MASARNYFVFQVFCVQNYFHSFHDVLIITLINKLFVREISENLKDVVRKWFWSAAQNYCKLSEHSKKKKEKKSKHTLETTIREFLIFKKI